MPTLLTPRNASKVLLCAALGAAGAAACGTSHPAGLPTGSASSAAGAGSGTGGRGSGGSPTGGSAPDAGQGGSAGGGSPDAGSPDAGDGGAVDGTPANFNVFDQIPQFGVYTSMNPANYTPPPGVLMWSYGTVWLTQLTAKQKAAIGSDLAAQITYVAQCDNYDRIGGLFIVTEPKGQAPQPSDPRTEIVRFITPFSDFAQGPLATHVYPLASIAPFAETLADPSHDVWIGIAGGSNPYAGDPCVALDAGADFSQVGFLYSVDFVSTQPLVLAPSVTQIAVSNPSETAIPITGTLTNPGTTPLAGHVTVIVSGHGSGAGGDEYESTNDTLAVNGTTVGTFGTAIDCAPYATYSPDGNPGIFQGNTTVNPRNWCPGAPVLPHTFPLTLSPGTSTVSLDVNPSGVPSGSYYATSITFTSP